VDTTSAPGPITAAAPATSEPVVLEGGRHPVSLKTVDPERRTITFDLVQFFTGDAAAKAAAEDGEESPPLAGYFPASDADPFWITVDGGQVTRIAQQYLP
jgi:hypothetical protein